MNYWYQSPTPELSSIVRTVLIVDGNDEEQENKLPLVTQGMPLLFARFESSGDSISRLVHLELYGDTAPAETWEIRENELIIAYFFQPFSLPALFNVSASLLSKERVDLGALHPQQVHALVLQAAYSTTVPAKIEALDHFIIYHLKARERTLHIIRTATDTMMHHYATDIISTFPGQMNISERTFQRMFRKFVGVSPTQYRRICQFHHSFSQVRGGEFEKLTDVAFDHGYADQSHFIRAFKDFTRIIPQQYLRSGLE